MHALLKELMRVLGPVLVALRIKLCLPEWFADRRMDVVGAGVNAVDE